MLNLILSIKSKRLISRCIFEIENLINAALKLKTKVKLMIKFSAIFEFNQNDFCVLNLLNNKRNSL